MSLLDDEKILLDDNAMLTRMRMEDFLSKNLLRIGGVSAVIAEDKECAFVKKLNEAWGFNLDYKIPFVQQVSEIIRRAVSPELRKHQSRGIHSIDCRTLRKGDAYGWLSEVAEANDNPILIIKNITQIPDGDQAVYDNPIYVANLLLRSWKNEQIYANNIHIDRSQLTVILTCLPQDADILQRECGLCSYGWIGDFDAYIAEMSQFARKLVEDKR